MITSSHGAIPLNGEEVRPVTSGAVTQESGRKSGETNGEAVRTNGEEVLGITTRVADKKIMETRRVVDTLAEDIPTVTEAGGLGKEDKEVVVGTLGLLEGKVVVVVVGQMLI